VKVISAKPSDPLDAFKQEIVAVEQAGALGIDADADADAAAGAVDPAEREGTPEELEFEDDDGTIYKWDHKLRKYMPAGEVPEGSGTAAAGGSDQQQQQQQDGDGYNIEAMTFVAEEEVIPTLAAVKAAEEAAAAAGSGGKGKKVCRPSITILFIIDSSIDSSSSSWAQSVCAGSMPATCFSVSLLQHMGAVHES
jgi:hypothetical protein